MKLLWFLAGFVSAWSLLSLTGCAPSYDPEIQRMSLVNFIDQCPNEEAMKENCTCEEIRNSTGILLGMQFECKTPLPKGASGSSLSPKLPKQFLYD